MAAEAKELRHITVVLDRSGSMTTVKNDTEGGLNTFIKEQAEVGVKTGVTLVEFDHEINVRFRDRDIRYVEPYELTPRGMTALLDAIGVGVEETDQSLKRYGVNSVEVVVVIVTDGEENRSRELNLEKVKTLIERKTAEGWTFIFLGADQDAITVAGNMGIGANSSLSYSSVNTSSAWGAVSATVSRGSRTGSYDFTKDERDASA